MDKELLYKYLKCQTSPQQEAAVLDWLEASPDNRRELKAMQMTMEGLVLREMTIDSILTSSNEKKTSIRRLVRQSIAIAGSLIIAAAIGFGIARFTEADNSHAPIIVEVPNGQRMTLTLTDGTIVNLNSGTRLEYPVVFSKNKRKVRVDGEAMFDVFHNPRQPFMVETFACDIEVLGTKFNVESYEQSRSFSTALLEGSIRLKSNLADNRSPITMLPDDKVKLVNGNLLLTKIANHDEFLWTDGIISLKNIDFIELMAKFERAYNVNIIVDKEQEPEMNYTWGKIRVSDGIDHAFSILQRGVDFKYAKNEETDTITIY